MMPVGRDIEAFVRLVEALRPWLGQVVFVGGWAHRLYRLHRLAQQLDYPPLMTRDADVAVPGSTEPTEGNIRERLLAAGFHEEFSGEHRRPITRYQLGAEYAGFYAEFLTPLVGSGYKRDKSPDVTIRMAGVSAQKVRYLGVLLIEPWSMTLGRSKGFPLSRLTPLRIPNAASYLAQKILINSKRKPAQRAKDVLYIHDTIETFGRSLTEVKRDWTDHVKRRLGPKARRVVERAAEAMFAEVTDAVRGAVREAASSSGRTMPAASVLEVCRAGLTAIFD